MSVLKPVDSEIWDIGISDFRAWSVARRSGKSTADLEIPGINTPASDPWSLEISDPASERCLSSVLS